MSNQTRPNQAALRQQAVRLRLQNKTLNEIQQQTGLSHPTIIAACKRFRAGGWAALNTSGQGRPAGSSKITPADIRALISAMQQNNALHSLPDTQKWLREHRQVDCSLKSLKRHLSNAGLIPPPEPDLLANTNLLRAVKQQYPDLAQQPYRLLICGFHPLPDQPQPLWQIYSRDLKQTLHWQLLSGTPALPPLIQYLKLLAERSKKPVVVALKLPQTTRFSALTEQARPVRLLLWDQLTDSARKSPATEPIKQPDIPRRNTMPLTHLQRLEAESIHIMREVVAETDNPVMLYSVGKDSSVMLHLARKAFYPSPLPFPLLHVDTGWKFKEMYAFRDKTVQDLGLRLITHINPQGQEKGINPFIHGSAIHTDIMKTEGLKQALNHYQFDAAFGGARRDEEKSRAKERVFSFRTADHHWNPKDQRPELWQLYNARKQPGESIRVFPLSNWTELDIWQYIYQENIPIVPLYFAAERPIVERDGTLIMVDDERMPLAEHEIPAMKKVRFRTLGCYPLTGAIESNATTLTEIIQEMLLTRTSERQGRIIDQDAAASMEKKKQEGYF